MFSEYTVHASGHNPRPNRKARTRNRINHKYSYYPGRFDVIACVGCGRCINLCPVNIDILDILEQVGDA
jgi:sulfhydrogenase subunit beta (sulfur reductase)